MRMSDKPQPTAALIEIVELGRTTDDTPGGSVITPNEIRINGTPILAGPEPITIHEMNFPTPGSVPDDLVKVTLTLYARRVTIAAEGDLSSDAS